MTEVVANASLLEVKATRIPAVKLIIPKVFEDPRGLFFEPYNQDRFALHGINLVFVQDNQSWSKDAGTVRGLHFQVEPKAQHKLVRVLQGRILDVAVDLRRASPTYGQWVSEELSADNRRQLLIPVGFAHGFCALDPDTVVFYKTTGHYSPEHELGLAWDDPSIAISWPVAPGKAILSEKDTRLPRFSELPAYFK